MTTRRDTKACISHSAPWLTFTMVLGHGRSEPRECVGLLCPVTFLGPRMQQCRPEDANAVQQSWRDEAAFEVQRLTQLDKTSLDCQHGKGSDYQWYKTNSQRKAHPFFFNSEMTGVEFALVLDRYPHLFVIQKQRRKNAQEGTKSQDIFLATFTRSLTNASGTQHFFSQADGDLLRAPWQYLPVPRSADCSLKSCCM